LAVGCVCDVARVVARIFLSATKASAAAQVLYLVRRALDIGLCRALLAVTM